MKQADPFKSTRTYSHILGCAGLLLFISTLLFPDKLLLTAVAVPLMLNPVFIYLNHKKYHFKYNKECICWYLPNSDYEKRIQLQDPSYTLEMNWKGLVFNGQSQHFEISLDTLRRKDRKRLYQELEAYYAEQQKGVPL